MEQVGELVQDGAGESFPTEVSGIMVEKRIGRSQDTAQLKKGMRFELLAA
jgi:hypothetical protein